MRYEFHPEAELEVIEAAAHYELEIAGLGIRFGDEVVACAWRPFTGEKHAIRNGLLCKPDRSSGGRCVLVDIRRDAVAAIRENTARNDASSDRRAESAGPCESLLQREQPHLCQDVL